MVHGDDSVAVGPDTHLDGIKSTLSYKYKIKIEQLGYSNGKSAEIRILSKVVCMIDTAIELEVDPRHAEIVIGEREGAPDAEQGREDETGRVEVGDSEHKVLDGVKPGVFGAGQGGLV